MMTDVVFACNVENNDIIVDDNNDIVGYVYSIWEEDDYIHIDTVDDDGEHTTLPFGPFDSVTIATNLEED